jgi:hypothetical protein
VIDAEPFESPDARRLIAALDAPMAGFKQIDCWGEYATAPTSVCYEKTL